MTGLICRGDQRREQVRAKTLLNGLDYLEVGDDQRTLKVYFLGKAPRNLTGDNCQDRFSIEDGRRVHGIRIIAAEIHRNPDPELDDMVELRLDRYGDFSTYTLRMLDSDPDEPIDPCYDHIDFTFKVDCPSDLDCKGGAACPPETRDEPAIDYLAKDYASFRRLILDRLAVVMPDWKERHVPDLGVTLVELLAYVGDYLSYYQDAVATEAYLDTARQRISVRRHARLVDYPMHEGCNARTWVCVQVAASVEATSIDPEDVFFITKLSQVLPAATPVLAASELDALPAQSYEAFEPLVADRKQPLEFRAAHNTIRFYTWGNRECCLPKGATRATLLDDGVDPASRAEAEFSASRPGKGRTGESSEQRMLSLKEGDVLLFKEVLGPKTGNKADADPDHRHAVRLTKVQPVFDPLDDTPLIEIEWSPEDALPFPLCLSATTDADHGCVFNEDISVACGNVVLVDHGRRCEPPEDLREVPTAYTQAECDCAGHLGDVIRIAGRYRPILANAPLTFSEPLDTRAPASHALSQDPQKALPWITLTSSPGEDTWAPHADLLGSGPDDRHFVIETDNEGRAHLRFGMGGCGYEPDAGLHFSADCRVGNGRTGNVGGEAIHHLVYHRKKPDGIDGIRNPLPAVGGTDPEPISEVKLLAPAAFRKQLQRAVIPDDYARIAERNPKVQKAAAALCWTGSWREMKVAVDPLGSDELDDVLRRAIEHDLRPFRRMGHDLRVVPARSVPLDIAMEVCVEPDHLRGHVKAALLDVFSNRIRSNGRPGFFHPDRLTFGGEISLSRLVAEAQAMDGVESVRVTRLQRQFERADGELEAGVLRLGPLEVARCDNDPDFPHRGRFELTVLGGR